MKGWEQLSKMLRGGYGKLLNLSCGRTTAGGRNNGSDYQEFRARILGKFGRRWRSCGLGF